MDSQSLDVSVCDDGLDYLSGGEPQEGTENDLEHVSGQKYLDFYKRRAAWMGSGVEGVGGSGGIRPDSVCGKYKTGAGSFLFKAGFQTACICEMDSVSDCHIRYYVFWRLRNGI